MTKKIRQRRLDLTEQNALVELQTFPISISSRMPIGHWLKLLRIHLRMNQPDLARFSQLPQSYIANIESGKRIPPISTLQRIFNALECDVALVPRLRRDVDSILRNRARIIALERLKRTMGTMALEEQAPTTEKFRELLEKRTDEILNDRREDLWRNE